MKYQPNYPDRFGSQVDARTWAHEFFPWYNDEHHHSGLGYLTPAAVHYGMAQGVFDNRQKTLQLAFTAHPERFVKGQPTPPTPPTAVWINPPKAGVEPIAVVEAGDPVGNSERSAELSNCYAF